MPTVMHPVCPIYAEAIMFGRDKQTGSRVYYCMRCQREYSRAELKNGRVREQALITPRHYERSA